MVEIAISVAAKVVEFLVGPIARPFSYIWNYKTNFDNLKTEVRKLEGQKETVQNSVDLTRRNGDQIKQRVSDWLSSVEKITDEASEVIEENQQANMKCFKGLCPNPKRHYQHSRKAVKKAKAIVELYADGNFQTVSIRTNPEEIWIPSYKGYMVFESRMSTLKNILDALSNPDINMVGIYGTGGIGKTTIAKEIGKHAEDKKLFNVVAFAEVAVKPDIKYIQQEIAEKLGLTFRDENPSGRARHLQQRLKQEEKVLLVLDNIWERLNLEVVGIPFGDDHKGCKLLLTARNLDVLSKMDSQRNFEVGFLDEGEAWSLFEKKAGSCDHLQALAKNVAEACGGLPIAIDSVAVALKNKEEFEWKDALRKLTTPSSSNFEGVAAETYSSIEISYSQLKEKELKSTFLLCCIMGYTKAEDLLAYGMGLGIFEDVEAMEDARNRVNTLVRKLKDSSLLLDINNKISLHDVVRDVGRSIASRDGHMFTVTNNCIPREWVGKDILKNCVGISLHNISKLPEEFECPKLQFFYLRTTSTDYCRVPDNFFAGMLKLKVLHLALELNSVPNSIRLLVNLQTLCIDDCKLRDIDFIGEFKQLEILRIHASCCYEIEMIPKKMCNLTGLRLLDLNDCYNLRNIPPNVLSTFTRLEELYLPAGVFRKCKIEWEVEGVNIIDELKHLMHLTTLKIGVADANVLPRGCFLLKKLERYEIIIGNNEWSPFYRRNWTSRMVQLNLKTSSCSDDVQKFLSVLDGRGFPELEYLHVENSPCFRTVVDCLESESCHHFLFLQSLSLHSVLNLEMIHNYPLKDKADSFHQLRTITVKFCHKLKNILSFSTYRALPLLQEVNVSSCDNMEEIFAIRREEEINNNQGIDQIEFKHLRTISVQLCNKLKNILSLSSYRALPLLQKVHVSFCNNIEEIFAIRREEDINNNEGIDQIEFKHLTTITVQSCHKLKNILSFSTYRALPLLQDVLLSFCNNMEEIFAIRREEEINNNEGIDRIEFKHLRTITVQLCHKLKNIFSFSSYRALPLLQEVDVSSCDNMEEIFAIIREEEINNNEGIDQIEFKHLRTISVQFCHKLKNIFSFSSYRALPLLQKVDVSSCDNMEEIFAIRREEEINNNEGIDQIEFKHLRTIRIQFCHKLKNILSFSSYRVLPLLQKVHVSFCDNIEEIFTIRREEDINNIEGTDQIEFKHLSSLTLTSLPKLTSFCSINNNKDMFDTPTLLFNQKVVFSNLEALKLCSINFEKIWHSELPAISSCSQCLRQLSIKECSTNLKVLFSSSTVAFSSLEVIEIDKMDDLETIWPNQLCNDSFCNLRSLTVTRCNKLLTIFQSNMLDRITRLESLTISDCDLVEEIFDLQEVDFEESLPAKEALLQELVINGLPKLKHIWNKDPHKLFSYQKLHTVKVHHCMNLKYLFPVSIAESLSELQQLDVHHCGVEEIVARDQGEAKVAATFVFPRITSLDLNNLPQLKTFYRGVHTSQWQNLKELTMCDCDKVELFASELFNFQENNESQHGSSVRPLFIVEKVTFPSLEEIKISESNNLKILWQKGAKESFCNLKSVEVSACDELLTIFQFNTLEGLSMSKLLTVTISNCASVEEIFDLQKVNFEESHSRAVMYHQLQQLNINRLPKLKHIWKKDPQAELSFEELPMPKSLKVRYCDLIEEIFDLQKVNFEESHSRAAMYQLQELNLEGLPKLKHIWNKDPRVELSFESLQQVKVSGCRSLKDLFPASIARNLSQLVQLNVDRCGNLEEIVAKEGEAKEAARFVFPKVTSITLDRLPQLRTFYRGVHSSKWEVLKELEVVGCDKIELLASQLSCFQENNIDISMQPPFFLVEKDSFPILEKLILIGGGARMMLQFSEELFCKLKFLQVYNDKSVHFPLCILKRFHHLHELHLKSNSYKEIFSYEEDETHVEKLTVGDCQNLIQPVPSSTSFQNLTVLKVWSCDGLKNLMTSSTAKRLVQLREMTIGSCKSMIDVVAKGGDVTEDKIIFSKLMTLTLGDLPSLSCFCSENYTFELPSLEEIIVYKCPEMKYFSLGDITTPILQKVRRGSKNYYTNGLNTTTQKTRNSRVDLSREREKKHSCDTDDDSSDLESSPTVSDILAGYIDDDSCYLEYDDDDFDS